MRFAGTPRRTASASPRSTTPMEWTSSPRLAVLQPHHPVSTLAQLGNLEHENLRTDPRPALSNGRLLARRQLPVGGTNLSLRQSAAEAAARARGREAHAAGTLGHDARPELHLRAPEPGHQEVRPRHDLRLRPRTRRARRWWPTPTSRARTARSIPTSARTRPDCGSSFRQFSFPGGIPSHASPECPGSIHEGGELGYSLSHSFGAAFDNPDLIVACVVGDGEAETGPLATAWHSNKFLDPATDGAVLPILHLNGYKIANPTLLTRIPREELEQLLRGYGWCPYFVEGHEPALMHEAMAATLDTVVEKIRKIQRGARAGRSIERPCWPMIVLVSPKDGPGRRWSMACRLKAPSAPTKSRSPLRPPILSISNCWKTG